MPSRSDALGVERLISVVIPACDEAENLARTLPAVFRQTHGSVRIEVTVVDNGSTDATASVARRHGARVVPLTKEEGLGNPAAARNLGAIRSTGDPIVFLDADCVPEPGWLDHLLRAHDEGHDAVGGSLDLPPGLSLTARLDYYCGWYHVHSRRPDGEVPSHPPGNLSVRREAFLETRGFNHEGPAAYAHEELAWQDDLRRAGRSLWFEPEAVVLHYNRSGTGNLLRRSYRWGYSALESKARTRSARMAWVYRYPRLLTLARPLLVPVETLYIAWCWLRAGKVEPLLMLPVVALARLAYGYGAIVGGVRWLRRRHTDLPGLRPRWE